jgi:hypothetical protein
MQLDECTVQPHANLNVWLQIMPTHISCFFNSKLNVSIQTYKLATAAKQFLSKKKELKGNMCAIIYHCLAYTCFE